MEAKHLQLSYPLSSPAFGYITVFRYVLQELFYLQDFNSNREEALKKMSTEACFLDFRIVSPDGVLLFVFALFGTPALESCMLVFNANFYFYE